jgi:5'-deoxynucleotidase YfbR-like HD superfamily hydrolase
MPHGDDETWIQTATGKKFYPLDPHKEDVCIEDIAASLAKICRFTGHCKYFYSVAQHSVLVSENVPRKDTLCALLHDGSEAYLSDLAKPIKHATDFRLYRDAEWRLMLCISVAFNLSWPEPESVKRADLILLATERRDLMGKPARPWKSVEGIQPLITKIVPWEWREAERRFLDRFHELTA